MFYYVRLDFVLFFAINKHGHLLFSAGFITYFYIFLIEGRDEIDSCQTGKNPV